MGKGDKKTGKGKRSMGSYGNSRKRKSLKSTVVATASAEAPVEKKKSTKKVKE